MRARPMQKTMKRRAPRRAIRMAARREKMPTVRVMVVKRARGRPEMAIWERRKDWCGGCCQYSVFSGIQFSVFSIQYSVLSIQ